MARPVVISSDDFAGEDELSSEQLDQLLVNNFTDIAANLVPGWDPNGLIIIPALSLNNTNSAIDNATVVLQGRLFEPKKVVSAKRFFLTDDASVQLVLKPLDARKFKFRGRLSSELLDYAEVDYSILKDGKETTPQEVLDLGFKGFCLRAYINPQPPAGWAKVDLSLFPLDVDELTGSFIAASDPRFPGISLAHPAGLVSMGPASSTFFPESDWGCPIAGALLALTSTVDHPISITAKTLKSAIGELLRTNIKPENKRDFSYLMPRWDKIYAKGPTSLGSCTPDFIWPPPAAPPTAATEAFGSSSGSPAPPGFRPLPPRGRTASFSAPPPHTTFFYFSLSAVYFLSLIYNFFLNLFYFNLICF